MTNRRILVTGCDGLLGWHTRVFLSTIENVTVESCNRSQFNSEELDKLVAEADAIVHLAGVNRGTDEEVGSNPGIAQRLTDACERVGSIPHILYSNSTHCDRDTVYGRAKEEAATRLHEWSSRTGARFSNIILPHVYGEHGRPFYNSVVSTFCHQVANGDQPQIHQDGELTLLHAQDVAQLFLKLIESETCGEIRPNGRPIRVSDLLDLLSRLHERYQHDHVIPNVDDAFDRQVFNTYRSYVSHENRAISLELRSDDRGSLFEAARADGLSQVFMSTTHPGVTRGEHFHFRKVERFLVLTGKARIRLRRVYDDEVFSFDVSGDELKAIDIPTLHTHNITNTGSEPVVTLFWASEHFDQNDPDTYAMPVEQHIPQAQ